MVSKLLSDFIQEMRSHIETPNYYHEKLGTTAILTTALLFPVLLMWKQRRANFSLSRSFYQWLTLGT